MLRYREIKLALMELIDGMQNGERLPSRTKLSKQLDSSRATIDKAVRELENEGILESRFGSGTYVARKLEGVASNQENWCLIVPSFTEDLYIKLAGAVKQAAGKRNANVILSAFEYNVEQQTECIKRLIMASVDGFIIVPALTNSMEENISVYRELRRSKVPFVFCNRDVEGVYAPIVKSNDFYGGYIAALHLIDCGYRNIAYFARHRYRTSIERCQGYVSALQHKGIPLERKRILMANDDDRLDSERTLGELLDSNVPVDAVCCFNDLDAIEALQVIKSRGLRVSDDIGVIGYDYLDCCAKQTPPLSSVSIKIEEIGFMAAHVLGKQIDGHAPEGFAYYLVEPEVVAKESCLGKYTKRKGETAHDEEQP